MNSRYLKIENNNNLDYLKIDNPLAEATISLQGAHVSWWRPKSSSEDVLWLSSNADLKREDQSGEEFQLCGHGLDNTLQIIVIVSMVLLG